MEPPIRSIQSLEILSLVYPPGSTIVIEDNDLLLEHSGDPMPVTVVVVRRTDYDLTFGDVQVQVPTQANIVTKRSSAPLSQPLSAQSSKSSQSAASQPLMHEVRSRIHSGNIAAATRSFSGVGEALGNASARSPRKAFASQVVRSPPPTLVDPDSCPSTPFNDAAKANEDPTSHWIYHRSTFVSSPRLDNSSPNRSPERRDDYQGQDIGSSQPWSSQSSGSQSSVSTSTYVVKYC